MFLLIVGLLFRLTCQAVRVACLVWLALEWLRRHACDWLMFYVAQWIGWVSWKHRIDTLRLVRK